VICSHYWSWISCSWVSHQCVLENQDTNNIRGRIHLVTIFWIVDLLFVVLVAILILVEPQMGLVHPEILKIFLKQTLLFALLFLFVLTGLSPPCKKLLVPPSITDWLSNRRYLCEYNKETMNEYNKGINRYIYSNE